MTQEDKNLLLKDLCARLPYGVKIDVIYSKESGSSLRSRLCSEGINTLDTNILWLFQQNEIYIKPYLFPLHSLTLSEAEAIEHIIGCNFPWNIQYGFLEWTVGGSVESETFELKIEQIEQLMEFLNSHHIDYRGLIPMGSAIDATNLNIY